MKGKGQITLFIILGIIIVVAFAVFFAVAAKFNFMATEENEVTLFIEECAKQTARDALERFGMQYGLYLNDYYETSFSKVNYAYNTEDKPITKEEAEEQLEIYIANNIPNCINNFKDFPGVSSSGGIKTGIVLAEDDIVISLDYPVTMQKEGKTAKKDKFRVELPVRLKMLIETAKTLVDKRIEHPDYVELLPYLGNLEANSYVLPYNDTKVFVMEDPKSSLNNKPYIFMFAVK